MLHNFLIGIELAQGLIKKYPEQENFYLVACAEEADYAVHAMIQYLETHRRKVQVAIFWLSEHGPATRRYAEVPQLNSKQICLLTANCPVKNYTLIGEAQSIYAASREIIYFKKEQFPKDKSLETKTKLTKSKLKMRESKECKVSQLVKARRELLLN